MNASSVCSSCVTVGLLAQPWRRHRVGHRVGHRVSPIDNMGHASDNPLMPRARQTLQTVSLSMWAFLVIVPFILLLAARRVSRLRRRIELQSADAAVTHQRSLVARLWPAGCAAASTAVLVAHVSLQHPDGSDFEGIHALRFFTAWCFAGVVVYFTAAAAQCVRFSREEAIFYTVAPLSLLTTIIFWLVIFPSLPPRLQSHALRVDELCMHALSVPALLVDVLLCAPPEAHAGRTPGLWLRPVAFAASYLLFHWAWLAYVPSGFQPASCYRASTLPIMKADRGPHV